MPFWNSLETLHRINSFLIIGWVIFTALFGTLSWKIQTRITKLNLERGNELRSKLQDTEKKADDFEQKYNKSESSRIETEKQLKAELEKTTKKITPPNISQSDFKQGAALLVKLSKRKFVIKVMSEDFEGQNLGNSLANMLKASKWELAGIQPHGGWRFDDGIKIIVQSKTKEIDVLSTFLNKLKLHSIIEESAPDDFVRIFIGKIPR